MPGADSFTKRWRSTVRCELDTERWKLPAIRLSGISQRWVENRAPWRSICSQTERKEASEAPKKEGEAREEN